MSDENGTVDYLQSFLKRAQEALSAPAKVSGTFAKHRLDTGYMVYGLGSESRFFDGGTSERENSVAYDAASAYAKEHGAEGKVVFAIQLTTFGGTQYPVAKMYNTDDGNVSRVVMNFSSQHPITKQYDNPGVSWKQMATSFGEGRVESGMIGKEFWGHVGTTPHPYFDKENAETHVKYVAQWDNVNDQPRRNDNGEVVPEFLQYVKAAFATREELVDYAYGLGVTDDGSETTSNVPAAVGAWKGSDKAWQEAWPKVLVLLQKVAKSDGKPKPVVAELYAELANDWALTEKEVDEYIAQLPPF